MNLPPNPIRRQVSPALRDRFLIALDQQDQAAIRALVVDLVGCGNFLPTTTCILLGLAPASTYGDAAETITRTLSVPPAEALR
jgi:hypothetical protein